MGRYIEWDDVIDRYPELNTLAGADEMSSAYIVYSEAFTDSMLANCYTVPFSNNNMTVRDLSIDCTYWRAARFKIEDAMQVGSAYFDTIEMLKKGTMVMIDTEGKIISGIRKEIGLVSTTQSYHSAFGMHPDIEWHIDEDNIIADRDVD